MDNTVGDQEQRLKTKGRKTVEIDTSDAQQFMTYHNPETGQEFPRLPADSVSVLTYTRAKYHTVTKKKLRGPLLPGPASEALREKWEAGREQRDQEAQLRLSAVKKTKEFKEVKEQSESVPRSELKDIVQEAVQAALKVAGVEIPSEPEINEPDKEVEIPLYGTQLPMFDSPA